MRSIISRRFQLQLQWAAGGLVLLIAAVFIGPAVADIDEFDGSSYARNVSLDNKVNIFWTIDTEAATIRLALHAEDASASWAGVGVSEMGGMEGADLVVYETATGEVTDAHALAAGRPVTDECTQDWTLLSAEAGTDGLVFEVVRDLDTGDPQDRVFRDDTDDFIIPPIRTYYETTCVNVSDFPTLEAFHAVGFEGVVEGNTSDYVHHLLLRAYYGTDNCGQVCERWVNEAFPEDAFDPIEGTIELSEWPSSPTSSSSASLAALAALNISYPSFCQYNYADIFTWTPGASDYELPEDVGFRFGEATGGFSSVSVQTHYNNPEENVGVTDSSGVRIYYTEELRPMDMGTMELGDPLVELRGAPMHDGKSAISFECPGSCTEDNFELDSVTVFGHFLHMHENGKRLVTTQYRDDGDGNEVVVFTAEVEYYSFQQAGAFWAMANDSVTIQKGDRFETTCYYDTAESSVGSENASFGFGSENEMCVDFVFYYPSQYMPASGTCGYASCNGSLLDYAVLPADSDFGRTFGIVDDCSDVLESKSVQSSRRSKLVALIVLPATPTTSRYTSSM
eukprot:jgi/Undpi1/7281/HiC_scaffold_22.g09754.m1